MTALERRKSPRARCRFRCELTRLRKRAHGTVVDVSEGGLSVYSQPGFEQGDALLVRIEVPDGSNLEIETLVWHVRRARRRDTGEACQILGLMLSKAPDDYLQLVPRSTPDERPGPDTTPEVGSDPLPDPGIEIANLHPFHIRVKARAGPRTRVLSLSAESEHEARILAVAELENEWDVLEVQPA